MQVADLEYRIAEGLQNLLAADPVLTAQGVTVYRWDKIPSDPSVPAVVVSPRSGEEIAPHSFVFRIDVAVQVLTAFGETDADYWQSVRTYAARTALDSVDLKAALEGGGGITGGLKVYDVGVTSFSNTGSDKFHESVCIVTAVVSIPDNEERVASSNFGTPSPPPPPAEPEVREVGFDLPKTGISANTESDADKWYGETFNVRMGEDVEIRANIPNALNGFCEWSSAGVPLPWGNSDIVKLRNVAMPDSRTISVDVIFVTPSAKKVFRLPPLTMIVHPAGVPITNAAHVPSPKARGAAATASVIAFREADGVYGIAMGDQRGLYPSCRFVAASAVTLVWDDILLADGFERSDGKWITIVGDAKSNTATAPTYAWKKDGQTISGATNSSYEATEAGIYSVTATDGAKIVTGQIIVS